MSNIVHVINSPEFEDSTGVSYRALAKCMLHGRPVTVFATQVGTACCIELWRGARLLESVPVPAFQSGNIDNARSIISQIKESGFSKPHKRNKLKRRRKH